MSFFGEGHKSVTAGPAALLDAEVAEKIMGLKVHGFARCWAPEGSWSAYGPIEKDIDLAIRPVMLRSIWEDTCACEHEEENKVHTHFCETLGHCSICFAVVLEYSTQIECAWKIVDRIEQTGGTVVLATMKEGMRGNFVEMGYNEEMMSFHEHFEASAPSMPEAICRAALKVAEKFKIRSLTENTGA